MAELFPQGVAKTMTAGADFSTPAPWLSRNMGNITAGLNAISSFMPTPKAYEGKEGQITQTADGLYDIASSAAGMIPGVGQYIQGGMAAAKLLSGVSQTLGGGTDGMTKLDAFGDSVLGQVTGFGMINGFGGKKSKTFDLNNYVASLAKSSYGGTVGLLENAKSGSGKKYGLFSGGARKKANQAVDLASRRLNQLKYLIKDKDMALESMGNSVDLYNTGYANELLGGYEPLMAAKKGVKLPSRKEFLKAKRVASAMKVNSKKQTEVKKEGGLFIFDVHMFQKGGKTSYEEWLKGVNPDFINPNYDLKTAYEKLPERYLELWKYATNHPEKMDFKYKDKNGNEQYPYHLPSIIELDNGDFMFLKKGKDVKENPELQPVFDEYNNDEDFKSKYDIVFDLLLNRNYFRKKLTYFKKGGKLDENPNIIPEGALHARLHHIDDNNPELKGEITRKGIPVVTEEDGGVVQHAEIEKEEIIFNKEVTEELEKLYKEYNDAEDSSKKDEIAIKAGKIITHLILENTIDKTGLLDNI